MCFVAAVAAVFAISFAAIIYTGELAPFFGRGIGLTLMGGTVLALVGAFTLSYRGSLLQPQDLPAILLAGGVATMIAQRELSGEILFATVACLISVASLATGIVAVLVSKLRLAVLARYIPYPVLAGFLATTGLLLLLGGMGVAVGESLDATNLARFLEYDALLKWVPVTIAALGIVVATRLFSGHLRRYFQERSQDVDRVCRERSTFLPRATGAIRLIAETECPALVRSPARSGAGGPRPFV